MLKFDDMNSSARKLFIGAAFLCLSVMAFAQGKMYTRRVLLEDFSSKTVKVLSTGSSLLDVTFREELKTRWYLSPYEFCNAAEYDEFIKNNDYYTLCIASEGGVAFLCLNKGGKPDESDNLLKGFEVVRIPIANSEDPSGRELIFLGAFIEILQNFVKDAMTTERSAYAGLKVYNTRSFEGRILYLNSSEPEALYVEKIPQSIVGVCIHPSEPGASCYKMLIAPDSNELFYYRKDKYKSEDSLLFDQNELKQFVKRNAILP